MKNILGEEPRLMPGDKVEYIRYGMYMSDGLKEGKPYVVNGVYGDLMELVQVKTGSGRRVPMLHEHWRFKKIA